MSSRTVHRIFPNRFDPGDLSSIYFAWDRGSPHPNRLSLVASYRVAVPEEIREHASSGCCLYFSMLISYRYCGSSLSHFFYRVKYSRSYPYTTHFLRMGVNQRMFIRFELSAAIFYCDLTQVRQMFQDPGRQYLPCMEFVWRLQESGCGAVCRAPCK